MRDEEAKQPAPALERLPDEARRVRVQIDERRGLRVELHEKPEEF